VCVCEHMLYNCVVCVCVVCSMCAPACVSVYDACMRVCLCVQCVCVCLCVYVCAAMILSNRY